MSSDIKIAISIGDLAGIGPEIVFRSFSDKTIFETITPIVYASSSVVKQVKGQLGTLDMKINYVQEADTAKSHQVNLLEVWEEEIEVIPGIPSKDSGICSFKSLDEATSDLLAGEVDALVTAPIDKKNIQSEAFNFPGHTEYLAKRSNSKDHVMLLCSGGLRVGVVTGHIPVHRISSEVTQEKIVRKAEIIHRSLQIDFGISKPRIAILGLNPHAGDGGLIGKEDQDIIEPACRELQAKGIEATGPYPADGLFGSSKYKEFDAILAMYHDQGLVPFKALSFGSGVNFTAGLPIVRTSPDHGTAFDIAGKGLAETSSFIQALMLARDIYKRRISASL